MGKSKVVDVHIHVYRAVLRMSQRELAEKVGVARQTIIKIERNKQNPSLLLIHDIAEVLGVTIEQLYTFGEEENETEKTVELE
ncbi:helix-turn-helix transcriptional regulator [Candidatus Enterococcus ikei]|uniref:Helix-turn-helix transcriptional regulator n=1 Tax=Candidatus Enterococcus ikei TaxID=2815326 RepID=A0ABS3H2C0_9ENTE|nr:helix-turn-helix transcriptional regulator [Enterococcus sp. DIV0869a]MBO0441141.1 helix-turn-helix transcriptional regulator [Enterococcus sp. DIV0869a]